MSNQTHTRARADAATRRRMYLVKRSALLGAAAVAVLIFVYGGFSVWYVTGTATGYPQRLGYPEHWLGGPMVVMITVGSALALRSSTRRLKTLPHVPAVAQQLAALPAASVLVRGSEQPAASPAELLRAAHEGAVEPASELLRAESRAE